MSFFTPHTIRIRIPNAKSVAILGDFNNWHSNAHPLIRVGPDLWERIIDLSPGKHRYAFFVIDDIADENLRTRVVANGSVLWVPDNSNQALSITAHPSLSLPRAVA